MIKVTLEFENVDAAIVGLSKLVAVPLKVASESARKSDSAAQAPGTATKPPRRGRSDKGQPRGSYIHGQNANTTNAPGATTVAATASGAGVVDTAGQGTTDPRTAAVSDAAQQPTSTTPNPAVLAPEPAAPVVAQREPLQATGTPPAAAVPKIGDAQAAIAKLFEAKGLIPAMDCLSRYGAKAVRELKPEHYAPFIADVNAALAA